MKDFLMKTIFCLLVFASCKSAIINEENVLSSLNEMPDDALVTPYTDMTTSENIRSATNSDPDVVNWKVARFFAVEDTKLDFWEIAGRYYQCQLALVERP